MTILARLADLMLECPSRSALVYRAARRIVNRWQGENDWRMQRNGELRFACQVLPQAEVVFDVGANVGEWATEALRLNSHVELHCFEPSLAAFARLKTELSAPGVHLNNMGVGEAPGTLDLFIYGDSAEVNSLYKRRGVDMEPLRTQQVQMTTLDAYTAQRGIERIDYVKVDVEGHDLAVLKGGRGLIHSGRIDFLQFEYGPCYSDSRTLLRDVWDFVDDNSNDYEFFKILPRRLQKIAKYEQRLENLQLSNYIIVHQRALARAGLS